MRRFFEGYLRDSLKDDDGDRASPIVSPGASGHPESGRVLAEELAHGTSWSPLRHALCPTLFEGRVVRRELVAAVRAGAVFNQPVLDAAGVVDVAARQRERHP